MKTSFTIRYHHDIVTRPAKITVSVTQTTNILYKRIIDLRCFFSPLKIEFEFDSLDPLQLIFETDCKDMDLFPLYIDRIELDDLIDVPFIAHSGQLNNSSEDSQSTNCLYTSGQLIYNFKLPLCSNCRIL